MPDTPHDDDKQPEMSGRKKRRILLVWLAMMLGVVLFWAIAAPAVMLVFCVLTECELQ